MRIREEEVYRARLRSELEATRGPLAVNIRQHPVSSFRVGLANGFALLIGFILIVFVFGGIGAAYGLGEGTLPAIVVCLVVGIFVFQRIKRSR